MPYKIIFCVLFLLKCVSPLYVHAQKLPIKYLNAGEVINMAKSSGKPYLWVTIYVPKCANASELFTERVNYYNKKKDKVNLVMLSILTSNDNVGIVADFSKSLHFETPFYVMDTMYIKENIRETPVNFMKDLHQKLGVAHQPFQHIIIDNKGKLVYQADDIDLDKLDSILK